VRGTLPRENTQMRGPMSKDNIMDKIRKLLAMADKNSGASENEMMTAMAMAQALMRRHHLSQRFVQRTTAQNQSVLN
jgi:Protein of unknown function (DUF2786)